MNRLRLTDMKHGSCNTQNMQLVLIKLLWIVAMVLVDPVKMAIGPVSSPPAMIAVESK